MVCENLAIIGGRNCRILLLELLEQVLAGCSRQDRTIRQANHIDNQLHLFALIGPREEGEPSKKLDQNATQRPHVNLRCVREQTKHDVGCTVEA